jgi:FkbM family methyltransferase
MGKTMENISAFKRFKLFVSRVLDKVAPGLLYGRRFYSQAGEDMLLSLYYEGKKHKGFYVDVGAHHPYRFSNTAYFYRRGWRGINIEPTPSLFKAFPRRRRRDINLNVGIGNGEKLTFYVFNEGALNTFDPEIARSRDGSYDGKYRIIDRIEVQTRTLADILDKHLPAGTPIDLLTIDVEGMDFAVLKSNDWTRYLPQFILVECESELDDLSDDEIYQFLHAKGYSIAGRTLYTTLFKYGKEQ